VVNIERITKRKKGKRKKKKRKRRKSKGRKKNKKKRKEKKWEQNHYFTDLWIFSKTDIKIEARCIYWKSGVQYKSAERKRDHFSLHSQPSWNDMNEEKSMVLASLA
jgi:hypothetical protein